MKASEKISGKRPKLEKVISKKVTKKKTAKSKNFTYSSSESSEGNVDYMDESNDGFDDIGEECVGCDNHTKLKCDWIQCIRCSRWLHESCTSYNDVCQGCGKAILGM